MAGSENQQNAKSNSSTQFGEAVKINLSLTYLGTLLRDVALGKKFVNYRNSKLTMLLKDSLGGNTKTCVIANISAAEKFLENSISTLKFASHLKFVRNNAKRNVEGKDDCRMWKQHAQEMQKQLEETREELEVRVLSISILL